MIKKANKYRSISPTRDPVELECMADPKKELDNAVSLLPYPFLHKIFLTQLAM